MDRDIRRRLLYGAAAAAGGLVCVLYAGLKKDMPAALVGILLLVLGSATVGFALYSDE